MITVMCGGSHASWDWASPAGGVTAPYPGVWQGRVTRPGSRGKTRDCFLSHTLHETDPPEGEVHGRRLQRGFAVMPLRTHLHGRASKTEVYREKSQKWVQEEPTGLT